MNLQKSFQEIRQDFPILETKIHGNKQLIYLDSAATSQKPMAVIQAMNDYYEKTNANIHRGIHALAEAATAAYESARKKTAKFVGVEDARQIVFTRNTTESINLVAYTWGRKTLQKNDLIVLTEMEHHSNLIPWYILAEEKGLEIAFVRVGMMVCLIWNTTSNCSNASRRWWLLCTCPMYWERSILPNK